jgi:hypothetical protein
MSGLPTKLVIGGNQIILQGCTLYTHWVPVLNAHHVVPESWWVKAGQPVASPLRELCPNCHTATHAAIDGLLRGLDVSLMPPRCVALAKEGIAGALAAGLTPAPTL